MGAPVVYFEIAGRDGPTMQRFYSTVFGWTTDTSRVPGYAYVATGSSEGIGGGIRQDPPDKALYVRVPDLQASLDAIFANGGSVLVPLTVVPGVVTFALFRDPEGNVMGLMK